MNKNHLSIIKAVILIVIIGLLSTITIFQNHNKNNLSSAGSNNPVELQTPTYKYASKSNNQDIAYYNTLAGSQEDTLKKVIVKDNYFLIGTTNSCDGDFGTNLSSSIFVSKMTKSGTIIKTITLPCLEYYDCVDYQDKIIISYSNDTFCIAYINYNLDIEVDTQDLAYNKLLIIDNSLYAYNNQSSLLLNTTSNTTYNLGYNNYMLDSVISNDKGMFVFIYLDSFVMLKLDQLVATPLLELESCTFTSSQYDEQYVFISVVVDHSLIVNQISYDAQVMFCYVTDFSEPNYVYIHRQDNGYDLYLSNNNIAVKVFLCLHGDEIERQVLDLLNLKNICLDDSTITYIGTTLSCNTIVKNDSSEYIINGGQISPTYYDPILNVLFCTSDANSLDLTSVGGSDVYIFKLQ